MSRLSVHTIILFLLFTAFLQAQESSTIDVTAKVLDLAGIKSTAAISSINSKGIPIAEIRVMKPWESIQVDLVSNNHITVRKNLTAEPGRDYHLILIDSGQNSTDESSGLIKPVIDLVRVVYTDL